MMNILADVAIQNNQGAYGSSGTFATGNGSLTLGGSSNPRGIGVVINANRDVGTTLTYGGNYETFGLLAVANVGTGGGYGTTGVAGYAESDGSVYGLRADAKTTSAGSLAAGLYVGSVTGSSTNYGVYVSDTTLSNYMGSITFPATQAASSNANTLDDYEEGTWTGTFISSGGTNPTVSSYANRTGKYVKVGQLVYFMINIGSTTISGGSGQITVSGLPFTSNAGTWTAATMGYNSTAGSTAPTTPMVGHSTTNISMWAQAVTLTWGSYTGCDWYLSGSYVTT